MQLRLIFLSGLSVLLIASYTSLPAAEDLFTGNYGSCIDRSEGVNSEMHECISEEYATQDARLNGAYKKLVALLAPARKQHLVAAQRLWIQYRDANCAFYADPDGGTAARLDGHECSLQETAERAKEIEDLAIVVEARGG